MLQHRKGPAQGAPPIAPQSPRAVCRPSAIDQRPSPVADPPSSGTTKGRKVGIALAALALAIAAACTAPAGPQPSGDDGPDLTRPQPAPTEPQEPTDPQPEPLPPAPETQLVRIDFTAGTPGYSAAGFAGLGLLLDPPEGYLDAAAWQITGFSDGDLLYGQESTEGDFARGLSKGGVGTGGLYAFVVEEETIALGVQPTATDFAPGSIAVRVPVTLESVDRVTIAYSLWVYNDQNRSQAWSLALSGDDEIWFDYPELTHITPADADVEPQWRRSDFELHVQSPPFAAGAGDWVHVRWSAEDHGGSGGRDEVAIGNIAIEISAPAAQ